MTIKSFIKTGFRTIAVALCMLLATVSVYGQNVQERKRKDAEKHVDEIVISRQKTVVDKDLLDAYVRIMRYQTAWQDLYNEIHYNETTPDDYLTIAVNNVRVGNPKSLSSYMKAIRVPASDILSIDRQMMCERGEGAECTISYEVLWSKEGKQSGLKFHMPSADHVDE